MKFRDQKVDGFFVIHTASDDEFITMRIKNELDKLNADMLDVQYSTHLNEYDFLINDVLVMYAVRKGDDE